jgi:hypothetical protein
MDYSVTYHKSNCKTEKSEDIYDFDTLKSRIVSELYIDVKLCKDCKTTPSDFIDELEKSIQIHTLRISNTIKIINSTYIDEYGLFIIFDHGIHKNNKEKNFPEITVAELLEAIKDGTVLCFSIEYNKPYFTILKNKIAVQGFKLKKLRDSYFRCEKITLTKKAIK